jgi:hypothetical protein
MFGVLAVNAVVFGMSAVLVATIGDSSGVALIVLAMFALLLVVGLRAQQRTAVRLTVSGTGLDVEWILGSHITTWQRVRRIRLLRSRWGRKRIRQVEVQVVGDRPLMLFNRLSEFDRLVSQLRQMQPQLVEE